MSDATLRNGGYLQEELGVAAGDCLEKSVAVRRRLGDGLAESQGVHLAHITGEVQVMRRDSSCG